MQIKDEVGENDSKNVAHRSFFTQKIVLYSICGIVLFFSAVILITFIAIYASKSYLENYAVVIDAGSTGSRAFLYRWRGSGYEKSDVVTELSNCKADTLQKLDWTNSNNALIQCISQVISDIPLTYISKPYICLASTAGMRLYSTEHPRETELLFKNINDIFEKKNWKSEYIGIITGEVEGISAWITANFLKNKVGKGSDGQHTVGIMDLGGSSTQIAYEMSSSKEKIELYGQSYPIFSKSYLCLGTNMFYLKYMTYVSSNIAEQGFNCLLKNTRVILKNDIKMCRFRGTENINFENMPKEPLPDVANCKRQIKAVVETEMQFTKAPPNAKFVAISSYNYVYQFLKKYFHTDNSIAQFEQHVGTFCLEDNNEIKRKYPLEQKFAPTYCVIGMYILELFKGYGITDLNNLEFTDKIEGQNVGWNLGYMIDKTKSIPGSYMRKLSTPLFVVMLIIFLIIFIGSISSLLYLLWKRHQKVEDINV